MQRNSQESQLFLGSNLVSARVKGPFQKLVGTEFQWLGFYPATALGGPRANLITDSALYMSRERDSATNLS